MIAAAVAVFVLLAVLITAEIAVRRMESKVRALRKELALKRITATRMDMGGGRLRKNPTY